MQFARVVDVYEKIEATTKRLEMTELLVGLLRDTSKEDLDKVVYLTQGRIHPDYEGIELGLAEKMVMRVLAHATGLEDARVMRLWKEMGDLGLVAQEAIGARRQKPLESSPLTVSTVYQHLDAIARVLASKGIDGLSEIHLKLFRPIRAMLAERLETLEAIFERMGKAALEYKYDGLRVQAHVSPKKIELFSRHLENITVQFPEIVDGLRSAVRDRAVIVEGEAVPVDPNTGEFLPFQEVSRRRGRKTDLDRMSKEFPVTLFTFDCLLRGEDDLTGRPYTERRKALEAVLKPTEGIRYSTVRVTDDVKEAESFFDEALQAGCEGLMAKALDSTYEAGARGYQWIKFKKEYSAALSDTIDLVIVGAFAGRGKRVGSYGALLVAAYDEQEDLFRTTCKLGTGFDDETLLALPEKLKAARRDRKPVRVDSRLEADIWFEPTTVLEVRGAELTVSPIHTAAWGAVRPGAGLAIRFPRFTGRWRDDKGPEDATTTKELLEMYRLQLKQTKKGSVALA